MDAELQEAVIEARASIIWGESTEKAADALRAKGFKEAQIKLIIDTCLRERALEIRRLGLRDVVIGAGLLLLAAAVFVGVYVLNFHATRVLYKLFGAGLLLAGYGAWRFIRGAERLMDGARTSGSLADM